MIDLEAMNESDAAFWRKIERNYGYQGARESTFKTDIPKPSKQRGEPNALEADFAAHCTLKLEYEAITFHLMPGCSYTPDWVLTRGFTPTFIEVKSDSKNPTIKSRYAASIIKLKMCAKTYECMPFYLARKNPEGKWKLYPVTSQGIGRKPREVIWLNRGEP